MKRLLLILTLFLSISCKPQSLRPLSEHDTQRHFDAYNAVGTFVLRKGSTGEQLIYNEARAKTGFLPASTFKIFNSLLSLDLGVISLDDTIQWDGVVRAVPAWNQDQRMREAFQRSTVWFYQILARRIGQERMNAALAREGYGNRNTGGGIDQFWLNGDLRIKPLEQVDFLEKIKLRKTGFSNDSMEKVESLLLMESCPGYIFRGKTGWTTQDEKQIGWLVGWVERNDDTYYYAMNLESPDPDFPMVEARKKITRNILIEQGVLPAHCEAEKSDPE